MNVKIGAYRRRAGPLNGIYLMYASAVAAIPLAVATVAVYRVSGKWLWNIGGCEYPLFWAAFS